jgi:ribosomal protein L15
LPKTRGKGKFKSLKKTPVIVNIQELNYMKQQVKEITINSLIESGIVRKEEVKKYGVKLLGQGKINRPFIVKIPISKSAAQKIEKAGGKIEQYN